MRSIAVYNLKGGVGKTTIAVSLAWAAATLSSRRTLLWDLDAQGAASYFLKHEQPASEEARAVFARDVSPSKLIHPTAIPRLDLLPADASLRGLDLFLHNLGKRKRLAKLLERLGRDYDRIVLDCPPGLTETSDQVLRAADLIIVPLIPSPLSQRALDEVIGFLDRNGIRRGALLPLFNMVDRRRLMHRAALEANPSWPVIPMASVVEAMSGPDRAVGALPRSSPAGQAVAALWQGIERKLARTPKAG
jgi:cellulose biosynthesis protein BcsQ